MGRGDQTKGYRGMAIHLLKKRLIDKSFLFSFEKRDGENGPHARARMERSFLALILLMYVSHLKKYDNIAILFDNVLV